MSKGLICDQCGYTVALNKRGESESGEEAAWVSIDTTWTHGDFCTRACAVAFLNDEDFITVHDAEAQAIMDIARIVAESAAGDEGSDDH